MVLCKGRVEEGRLKVIGKSMHVCTWVGTRTEQTSYKGTSLRLFGKYQYGFCLSEDIQGLSLIDSVRCNSMVIIYENINVMSFKFKI